MHSIFPPPIHCLPLAAIPLEGVTGYISQSDKHQILFMEFEQNVEVSEHCHEDQWGVVLEGRIDLTVDGVQRTYSKGEHYFIPEGAMHSARIYAGYADVTFFAASDRYKAK
jgi:quercetin dioxygenase-like cupin family protein